MFIAESAIKYRTVTLVMVVALVIGGTLSFLGLGQLEDPEFTIFTAIVSTPYPGASPDEDAGRDDQGGPPHSFGHWSASSSSKT